MPPRSHNRLTGISTATLLVAFVSVLAAQSAAAPNRIGNFRVVEVSDQELIVTVDYFYNGEFGTEGVFIHATPEEKGGIFDPRLVNFDEEPLKTGLHEANLTITKFPDARSFTSIAISVCMSTEKKAILCKHFPRRKIWRTATADGAVHLPSEDRTTTGLPQILSFSTSTERIPSGNSATLSWQTMHADVVLIGQPDPNNKLLLSQARTVTPQGSMKVRPSNTTTYILQAERQGRSTRRQITVNVVPPIKFSFDAPKRVCSDRPFVLSWQTRHATDVTLNGRQVLPQGRRRVRDHRNRSILTYTLIAKNEYESLEARRDIRVVACPRTED